MAARNATMLSGFLHLIAISLILLIGQQSPSAVKPIRYQPVRLVALPGKPAIKQEDKKPQVQAKSHETKPKSIKKTKPVSGEITKKTTGAKSQGETEKTTPTKNGGGGPENIRLDGINFPYPYYLSNIQIKILSNFKPVIKARDAQGLKTVVFFIIDKSGRISDVRLESKSGKFLFDQEAQRAVLRSSPLPALPTAFGSDRLGVHFEFVASE